MKKENYNREIRKFLSNSYSNLWNVVKTFAKEDDYDLCNTIFQLITTKKDNKNCNVLINLIYMTGYQDLYIKLKRKEKSKMFSQNDRTILNNLENIKDTSDLSKLPTKYQFIMGHMIRAMIDFNNMNVYKKIIVIKSIDEETKSKLLTINPLFYQDIQNYDIEISLDYIKEKIISARKTYSEEKLMIDAGNFIKQLVKIKDKSGIKILCELLEEDIKFLNYYFKNNTISDSKEYKKEEIEDMHNRYMHYLSNSVEDILKDIKVYEIGNLIENSINNSNDIDLKNRKGMKDNIDKNLENKILLLDKIKRG